jgi:jumonji domain-containing protein 7
MRTYTQCFVVLNISLCFLPQKDGYCEVRFVKCLQSVYFYSLKISERMYRRARYECGPSSQELTISATEGEVRWSSVKDPSTASAVPGTRAIDVTVKAGQSLYLPAGWWHYVRQTNDATGKCVALNWWYDMEMSGANWVLLNFLRGDVPVP